MGNPDMSMKEKYLYWDFLLERGRFYGTGRGSKKKEQASCNDYP